jgi:cytochrome b subunit of formate dehydrogenase
MKIKHKFREHLIFKYKQVDCGDHIREYQKCRLWVVMLSLIVLIIAGPFIAIYYWIVNVKSLITYPMGQDETEEYTIYKKEEVLKDE